MDTESPDAFIDRYRLNSLGAEDIARICRESGRSFAFSVFVLAKAKSLSLGMARAKLLTTKAWVADGPELQRQSDEIVKAMKAIGTTIRPDQEPPRSV